MMKIFLVIVLFVAYCSAATPDPCCTETQWEGRLANADQSQGFFEVGWVSYDAKNSQEYFSAFEDIRGFRTNVTYILLWGKQTSYRLYESFGTLKCEKTTLTGDFPTYCVPSNSGYLGNFTIAGSLLVDAWKIYDSNINGVISVTRKGCYPVRNTLVATRYNIDDENFWDITDGIANPAIFTPPSICTSSH